MQVWLTWIWLRGSGVQGFGDRVTMNGELCIETLAKIEVLAGNKLVAGPEGPAYRIRSFAQDDNLTRNEAMASWKLAATKALGQL